MAQEESLIEEYRALPQAWRQAIESELLLINQPHLLETLQSFVAEQRKRFQVYPPPGQVFTALRLCSLAATKVVILGQDPYHGADQAHGLSFSVTSKMTKLPPSLRNIYKERLSDVNVPLSKVGDLSVWAQQGVLLLNTVFTVREGEAHSHQKQGWEFFSEAVMRAVSRQSQHCVFILWGKPAQKHAKLIGPQHTIIESAHPSPLSASRGFFGSQPFSKTNQALSEHGQSSIQW